MIRKSYTLKVKNYVSFFFFFLISHLPLVQHQETPNPKKKKSKRLTTCMISYLIIFVYAFNVCCLTDIYTKLYLEYYFRSLYNIYNMEVVHIKKINYFIFFLVPHDKFLSPPLLTPP